ncbi:MAG: hypothetical protein KAH31_10945 [Candidatus Sabulitectum sp.]|nr:hypothetical protein [Candidatus Sabulitectum sp.]
MMKLNLRSCPCSILFFTALLITGNAKAEEILFSDDFQSGEISHEWIFFGDPTSIIEQDKGNPAPSFNNNGDSMYHSGIKSRRTFRIQDGLVIQCDIFLSCDSRGTWVNSSFGICDPTYPCGNEGPPDIINFDYSFGGELAWMAPHLQGTLHQGIINQPIPSLVHMNQYLNSWHTFKIELSPEGSCSFFIDDSLISSQHALILDSLDQVGIVLEGRATSWGTALHDNLLVYVP